MKRFKEFIIVDYEKHYKIFKSTQQLCKLNLQYELVEVYRRISIVDLKEIIKFLQKNSL